MRLGLRYRIREYLPSRKRNSKVDGGQIPVCAPIKESSECPPKNDSKRIEKPVLRVIHPQTQNK